jgi:hypothetical protein
MQTAVTVLADADLEKKRRSKISNICRSLDFFWLQAKQFQLGVTL